MQTTRADLYIVLAAVTGLALVALSSVGAAITLAVNHNEPPGWIPLAAGLAVRELGDVVSKYVQRSDGHVVAPPPAATAAT